MVMLFEKDAISIDETLHAQGMLLSLFCEERPIYMALYLSSDKTFKVSP